MSAWLYLTCAILLEVAGSTAMKLSDGLSRFWPSILIFACYGLAFTCLAMTLRTMELSTAYAVWSAIGTALIAIIGVVLFQESMNALKAASLLMVILGVVGLRLAESRL